MGRCWPFRASANGQQRNRPRRGRQFPNNRAKPIENRPGARVTQVIRTWREDGSLREALRGASSEQSLQAGRFIDSEKLRRRRAAVAPEAAIFLLVLSNFPRQQHAAYPDEN